MYDPRTGGIFAFSPGVEQTLRPVHGPALEDGFLPRPKAQEMTLAVGFRCLEEFLEFVGMEESRGESQDVAVAARRGLQIASHRRSAECGESAIPTVAQGNEEISAFEDRRPVPCHFQGNLASGDSLDSPGERSQRRAAKGELGASPLAHLLQSRSLLCRQTLEIRFPREKLPQAGWGWNVHGRHLARI